MQRRKFFFLFCFRRFFLGYFDFFVFYILYFYFFSKIRDYFYLFRIFEIFFLKRFCIRSFFFFGWDRCFQLNCDFFSIFGYCFNYFGVFGFVFGCSSFFFFCQLFLFVVIRIIVQKSMFGKVISFGKGIGIFYVRIRFS